MSLIGKYLAILVSRFGRRPDLVSVVDLQAVRI